MAAVIETRGLTKSYKGVNALAGLDLIVTEHSIFGFLGPNGAGKSTTIKLLLGLIRPTFGGGKVFGLDIVRDSVAIRKRVGYLAQEPRYYDHLTARETLRFTARFFYAGPAAAIEERVRETLELVGLSDKADRPIKGFSGGERQRLGIAQAQINYPDLLILDEPAASLDPMGRKDVLDVMERLRKHCTIFYSTHILDDVQRVSDTVAILNHGQLVAQAPIEELLAGNGSTVYAMTLKGHTEAAAAAVRQQPWVSSLDSKMEAELVHWQVAVSDAAAAEDRLLRLALADEQCVVTEFGRRRYNLEEVFLGLVGGEQHGR
jgi:ABC-2 type transport system ATP-binding protein